MQWIVKTYHHLKWTSNTTDQLFDASKDIFLESDKPRPLLFIKRNNHSTRRLNMFVSSETKAAIGPGQRSWTIRKQIFQIFHGHLNLILASYIIRNVISVLFSLHYFLYFVYLQFCINPLNTFRSYLKSWPLKMFAPALLDSYWTEWGNVNRLNNYPLKQNVFVKQYMYDPACWQRSLKKGYFSTKVKVKVTCTSALTLVSLERALLVEPCQIWSLYLL